MPASYQDYVREAIAHYDRHRKHCRLGQAYFNALYDVNPELAKKIAGTDVDPFYTNSIEAIHIFLAYVQDNWASGKLGAQTMPR